LFRLTRRRGEELLPCAAAAALLAALFLWGPPAARFPDELSTAVYDRRGELLGAAVSPGGFWRFPAGGRPPEKYVAALVAYEDKRFFSHPGVDPSAIVRALRQNARAGRIVSGGSTISMQAARLARPGSPRTLPEKAAEAWLALRLEFLRGKRGVLALYAENAPFGGNVVGLEAASFRYFGRAPALLSWAEAATLAVLPNAPSAAHPGRNRELLLAKRDALLARLAERGALGGEELSLALAEPLPPEPFDLPDLAPQLVDRFRETPSRRGGGGPRRVETTVDAALQEGVAAIVRRRSERLAAGGVYNAACLVARIDTGEVLAYVANSGLAPGAGADSGASLASRGYAMDLIRAPRSSGSLLKPFLYAAALDAGAIGPRSLLADIPTRYGSYGPENASGGYSGAVRADEALARSLNVPFVRLLGSFGAPRFHALLSSTGMTTLTRPPEDYGLSLILGGAEVTLWEMAGRFAALARSAAGLRPAGPGGAERQYFDLGLTRRELAARKALPDPFSLGAAALTLEALSRVARPEEEAAWEDFASARRISWKTGTSFGFRDAWAIGVDGVGADADGGGCVVAVWAGNADGTGRPGLKGSAAAAPILFEVFDLLETGGLPGDGAGGGVGNAPDSRRAEERPAAFREVEACADSGWAAGPDCPRVATERVPAQARSLPPCPFCRTVALSADGAYRVRAEDEPPGTVRLEKRFVLSPAMERYYRAGHLEYRPLPPWRPGSAAGRAEETLSILVPEEGASLYLPIEITGRPGALVMSAAHRDAGTTLYWHLDGAYVGATSGEHRLEIRPGQGSHVVTVVDGEGREASRRFEVLSDR